MTMIPVNSLLTSDGQLVSLAGLRGKLNAKPIELKEGETLSSVDVSGGGMELSTNLAASLGVGTIFAGSGTLQSNEIAFWQDGISYADSEQREDASNIVKKTRWGYGLRILFRVKKLDTSVNLSYSMIGAGVQYGKLQASYEIQTIGLGSEALVAILDGMAQFGQLTSDTIRELHERVIGNLCELLNRPPEGGFIPRPLAVWMSLPSSYDPLLKAHDELFAMRRLRQGDTLNTALGKAGMQRSAEVIRTVYAAIAPNLGGDEEPSRAERDTAKEWLG